MNRRIFRACRLAAAASLIGGASLMANAQDAGGVDPRVAAANAATAVAQAEKAAAEARKAQAEAELAAFKAQAGEAPASGYKGDVALRDKAGTMEAALLAARATEIAAKEIAEAVAGAVAGVKVDGGRAPGILLFGAGEVPTFQAPVSFRAHRGLASAAAVRVTWRRVFATESTSTTSPASAKSTRRCARSHWPKAGGAFLRSASLRRRGSTPSRPTT